MSDIKIPLCKAPHFEEGIKNVRKASESGRVCGDGIYTRKCQKLMEERFGSRLLLTTSCSSALDMAAILLDIQPGDEVVMPVYTFMATANPFVLRGAKPVYVDIREDTMNIDENLIEEKITEKTKAIVPVHYAGVGCNMSKIMRIAEKHDLYVIEDAAQVVNASFKGKQLGTFGNLGAFSFHETKNFSCGEGGALIVNDDSLLEKAEITREKGTNRAAFFRGEIDKYTWVAPGSSFLPSDINAAILLPQLKNMDSITKRRKEIYWRYMKELKGLEEEGLLTLPHIPESCQSNYHIFHIFLNNESQREAVRLELRNRGIYAAFHFIPLHLSPMGAFDYKEGDFPVAEEFSQRLLRLPIFYSLTEEEQGTVIQNLEEVLRCQSGKN